jgi:hypothetical protein
MAKSAMSLPAILRGLGWRQNPDRSWTNGEGGRVSYNAARQYASKRSIVVRSKFKAFKRELRKTGDVQAAKTASGISERQLSVLRKETPAQDNPFQKVGGKWEVRSTAQVESKTPAAYRTLVTIDGKSHRALFQGSNLDKLNEHHDAVWTWIHNGNHDTSYLEAWEKKYPDATVYDATGKAYRIPKNTTEHNNAYRKMSKKGRKTTHKKYSEDAEAVAA